MDIVTKEATAQVVPVKSEHPNGEFDLILSTDDLDRDGENLLVDDWQTPLPEHLHFDNDHGMSVEKTAGSGVPRIENGQLRVRGTYAGTENGQTTRQLVNEGHIRTASVAYIERKDGKRELLNGSFVAVPANPNAKILSSKAAKTSGSPAGDSPTDTPPEEADQDDEMPSHDELVQAVHDAAVHLGADCYDPDADTGESEGANKSYNLLTRLLGEAVLKAANSKKPYGDVTYADPKNGKYPVDTEEHARAAWSYINMPKNAAQYSSGELNAIKGRIRAALSKFGVETSDESSGSKSVRSPQESAEESAAPAAAAVKAAAAGAAEESAEDAARARASAFLLRQSLGRILDDA